MYFLASVVLPTFQVTTFPAANAITTVASIATIVAHRLLRLRSGIIFFPNRFVHVQYFYVLIMHHTETELLFGKISEKMSVHRNAQPLSTYDYDSSLEV
jgi:fatty acid desaturase